MPQVKRDQGPIDPATGRPKLGPAGKPDKVFSADGEVWKEVQQRPAPALPKDRPGEGR